jgi:CPA1 family monovalent cation:H+ antiporter
MPQVQVVLLVLVLLGAAYVFAKVAAHASVPPSVAVTLVGIAAGGMLPQTHVIHFDPVLLGAFLPALIFESAWDMDALALRRVASTVFVLAVPGVLVTMGAIALGAVASGWVGWGAALTLGAILAATDPIAVLALFRSMRLPAELLAIVEGESIGNDAIALVLVQLIVPIAMGASGAAVAGSAPAPGTSDGAMMALAAGQFVYMTLAGTGTGIVCAFAAAVVLRTRAPAVLVIALTVVLAYGSYAAATALHASGILAVAAAGIVLRSRVSVAPATDAAIDRFWDLAALVANSLVFLLMGFTLDLERVFHEPTLFAGALAGVVVSRAILAYGLVARPRAGERRGWRHAVALAGLRGGLSVAMALGLPPDFPSRPEIIDAVIAVVFVTLVVQGWAIAPILRRAVPVPRARVESQVLLR